MSDDKCWPLIDDDDPLMRAFGIVTLATGTYWFIAPFIALSEMLGDVLAELFDL
ncbi:hypothetical protein [Mycolicibacterium houstonense]|uniref:hypothetical protein n=1 Tax=Mycolicibacterium houstonense TaxID=146021 RepID=UPI000AADFE04|nr:hypothetical protein [Mycolicibacterium houstonense]